MPTQRRSLEIAKAGLDVLERDLKVLIAGDLAKLEEAFVAAGAPWMPGRRRAVGGPRTSAWPHTVGIITGVELAITGVDASLTMVMGSLTVVRLLLEDRRTAEHGLVCGLPLRCNFFLTVSRVAKRYRSYSSPRRRALYFHQ